MDDDRQIIMHPPSAEQQDIISTIGNMPETSILRVSAVAGSGKTTTALHIAKAYPGMNILLLTYNRHLSDENMVKACSAGIANITMRTFHSFAGSYFGKVVNDDIVMIRCLAAKAAGKSLPMYDVIIFDEFQDTTKPLFDFEMRVMSAYPFTRFAVFGDPRQCIYQYNGATHQYMTLLREITGREVIDKTLSTSYRVSSGIADFVNRALIGGRHARHLIPFNQGQKPIFKVAEDMHCGAMFAIKFIDDAIKSGEYTCDDIFVLAASAKMKKDSKHQNMAVTIANILSKRGHLIFMDVDGFSADAECTEKKIVISSIHKSKGRERKLVIVAGFDSSYLTYFKRDYTDMPGSYNDRGEIVAPNEMYVVCTRASELLVLIATSEPAQFINRDIIAETTRHNPRELESHLEGTLFIDKQGFSSKSVTDHIASIPSVIKNILLEKALSFETYRGSANLGVSNKYGSFKALKLPCKSSQKTKGGDEYVEQVADINGVASTLEATYQEWTQEEIENAFTDETKGEGLTEQNLLTTATNIQSSDRGHIYRRTQIATEDWVPREKIFALGIRIRARLPVDRAEVSMSIIDWNEKVFDEMPSNMVDALHARFDLIYGDDIYEIKTTTKTSTDHILQAAVYRWMLTIAGDHVSGDDVSVFGARKIVKQLSSPSSYLRKSSNIWKWMREPKDCDFPSTTAVDDVTIRREKRSSRRARLVSFATTGRKRHLGAFRKKDDGEYIIVDADGIVQEDAHSIRRVPREIPIPEGRTIVYNCLLDETTEVTITDMKLFDTLMRSTSVEIPDDEFIALQKN